MKRLRTALVGYGRHAAAVLVPILTRLPVEIVALGEPDEARREEYLRVYREVPVYREIEELVRSSRPDAIVAAADPETHYRAARIGMSAGCNLFVEKPPTANLAEARELAHLERSTGRWTMAGFNRRWATAYRMAAEIVRRPDLGGPRMYYARYHAGDYGSESRLIENHIVHHLDHARWICGEIEEIFTRRVQVSEGKIAYDASFRSRSGVIGTIQCASMQSSSYPQEHLEVVGDSWEVIVDNHQTVLFNRDTRRPSDRLHDLPVALDDRLDTLIWNQNRTMFPPTLFQDNGFEIELEHFVRCCREGLTPEPHAGDFAGTMALLEAFARSTRAERPVCVTAVNP